MKCCVGQNFSKVYGYSFNTSEGVFTILDVNRQLKTVQTKIIKIPSDQKWVGLEMTTDGSLLIVTNAFRKINPETGNSQHSLKMMAVDTTNNKVNVVSSQDFDEISFRGVQTSRKIKGYDIFCVCAAGNVNLIKFSNMKFSNILTVPNIYSDRIIDVAFYNNWLIPITSGKGDFVKVIKFNA